MAAGDKDSDCDWREVSWPTLVLSRDGVIVDANDAAGRWLGCPAADIVQRAGETVVPALTADQVGRYLSIWQAEMVAMQILTDLRCADGRNVPAELHISRCEKHDQARLRVACRPLLHSRILRTDHAPHTGSTHLTPLSRVGCQHAGSHLATHLAHEINQPLGVIANYASTCAELVRRDGILADNLADVLGRISEQALVAGDRVCQLRSLIARPPSVSAPVRLAEIVRAVNSSLRPHLLPDAVRWETSIDENLQLFVDHTQLQHALSGLVRYAVGVVGRTRSTDDPNPAGCVSIHAATVSGTVTVTIAIPTVGTDVVLQEWLAAVSDPPTSHGPGFELLVSETIVENWGGQLWLDSSKPDVTAICFHLPG